MDKLVEYIAKSLVDHPENVKVTTREEDDSIVIELVVDPEDTGKVIGKQGRIAKAIRAIVKAASINDEKKVVVDIL
ncbi:MAG: KH domain-containing protein [Clostridia bacterium]|nr:KH domain-containing protein [Clostridia bacterium]MBR6039552.1 KH domain-containing protein [Clostridia bacterium]